MDENQPVQQDQGQNDGRDESTNQDEVLNNVKQRALDSLVPLLGSLDTSPERKFDICMSAIRSTDNRSLAPVALEAALAIEDTGIKAEALVELVNEVNYLQQPTSK